MPKRNILEELSTCLPGEPDWSKSTLDQGLSPENRRELARKQKEFDEILDHTRLPTRLATIALQPERP